MTTEATAAERRRARGATAWHSGMAAEAAVARHCERLGRPVLERRWRGRGGEIDLVARDGATTVFIEVKSGPDHATAAKRVSRRQVARLRDAASDYMDTLPDGSLSDVRFDVALVDAAGRISVIENALMDWHGG